MANCWSGDQYSMSPTSYLLFLGPLSERALGKSPYFSRPNRSFIDTFNGRTEAKSRAVELSANVAGRVFPPIFTLIVVYHPSERKLARSLLRSVRVQQRLDCAALVHRPVPLCHLGERQSQVENLAGIDGPVADHLDQLRQIATNRSRPAVQVDVRV